MKDSFRDLIWGNEGMNSMITDIKRVQSLEKKKRQAVREIQKYLLTLARAGMEVPRLRIDGIYGEETREGVRIFQALMGIPVTGIVDLITWNILYSEYENAYENTSDTLPIYPFEGIFTQGVVRPSERGNIVYILQIMLETVAEYYDDSVKQVINGIFDELTEENLKSFQRASNIPATGVLDKTTWNALSRAYNDYINRE